MNKPTLIASPKADQVLHAFGDQVSILLGGAETAGKFTLFLDVTPPGSGPPPHYHENEDEMFYPLEGQVEFFINGAWQEVAVGTAVFVPRGTVHTFRNSGDVPLKMLIQTNPSGFEIFFDRCAKEFAKPGTPDMERIVEISAEHGIHYITD